MGNQVSSMTPSTVTAGITSYVAELGNIEYEKSMGNARFLKTVRGRVSDTSSAIVTKIFVKPDLTLALHAYVKRAEDESQKSFYIPNVAAYVRIVETDRAVYLVRPYITSSLYDRISTRPFLTSIEKQWIVFQLCRAVNDAHEKGIFHGDIKTENVLVTSWNWAYLSDFASFKPTFVPEDNPADFSYFFDISGRRTCYLAPERFLASKEVSHRHSSAQLSPAMDIFSLGCVIAELYLEGTAIFTLSQLLRYRRNEYDPSLDLEKIEDENIRALVKDMIQLDPEARSSVATYLEKGRGQVFPEYFYDYLHPAMTKMASAFYEEGELLGSMHSYSSSSSTEQLLAHPTALSPFSSSVLTDIGDRRIVALDRLQTQMIARFGQNEEDHLQQLNLLILPLLCSSLKHARCMSSKLTGLALAQRIAPTIADEYVLDRILPYLIWLLGDASALVRSRSVQVIAYMLKQVKSLSNINSDIFPEYILPHLSQCLSDSDALVRIAYASNFPQLLETALCFFELGQATKRYDASNHDSLLPDNQPSYDTALSALQSQLQDHAIALLVDPDSTAPSQRHSTIHMMTYLNDNDWLLRCAFFETIVGVATFVGGRSLEEYILPLMVQSLADSEEYVIERALSAMTSLTSLGLFQKSTVRELASTVAPLMCHPNDWVRWGAISFILACGRLFSLPDFWSILYPIIRPMLANDITELDQAHLTAALKPPLSRALFDLALTWAGRSKSFVNVIGQSGNVDRQMNSHITQNTRQLAEDDQYMEKLQHMGMTMEDEKKLHRMREYIIKLVNSKQKRRNDEATNLGSLYQDPSAVFFRNVGVTPRTMFLTSPWETSGSDDRVVIKTRTRKNSFSSTKARRLAIQTTSIHELPSRDSQLIARKRLSIPSPTSSRSKSNTRISVSTGKRLIIGALCDLLCASNSSGNNKEPLSPKVEAKTSVSNMNAEAKLEMPLQDLLTDTISVMELTLEEQSNYPAEDSTLLDATTPLPLEGTSQSMKLLLEKRALEAFPNPLKELGPPLTTSLLTRHRAAVRTAALHRNSHGWRPSGALVAHLTEHTAAVNQICLAPDHAFFATCSDDGTVKIWDCSRLGRHFDNTSRSTYYELDGPVKCMTFIEGRHCIAAAAQMAPYIVDYKGGSSAPQYGRCHTVFEFNLEGEYAVQLEHYENEEASMLVYATSKGRLQGIDLRTMQIGWTFVSPPSHGAITSFVIDHRRTWLLSGSSRGVLTLWDLRFHIALHSWLHPRRQRIHRLMLHSGPKTRGRMVVISAGKNEVSTWDVEHMQCTDVFAARKQDNNAPQPLESYQAQDISHFETASLVASARTLQESFNVSQTGKPDPVVKAMVCPYESHSLVTASSDRSIRFWDTTTIEESRIVSGPDQTIHHGQHVRYREKVIGGIRWHMELPISGSSSGSSNNKSTSVSNYKSNNDQHHHSIMNRLSPTGNDITRGNMTMNTMSTTASSGNTTPHNNPRLKNNAILVQQINLLDVHADAITDLQLTEVPQPMLISADHAGVVKVFL
ncbi:hypothetical protein BDF22DRAFT_666984 [Syncephalis plumigaleata]|nr:hypothetical protein BDF22DRAFT_666984 [Syncephalis plumigaleata]